MGVLDSESDKILKLLEVLILVTPSIIAATSSLLNREKLKSVDKKLLQNNIQHALNTVRAKSNGENFSKSSCGKKSKGKSSNAQKTLDLQSAGGE